MVQIEVFDSTIRLMLMAFGVGALAGFGLLRWRRMAPRIQAALVSAAVAVGAALAGEWAIGAIVSSSAQAQADYNKFKWVLLSPWGRLGVVAGSVVAITAIGLSFWSTRTIASPWKRATLLGLRTGAVMAALILFLQPAIELRQVATEPNRVAVLVDSSSSMELRDKSGGLTRTQRVRELLQASSATIDSWRDKHLVDFFHFNEGLTTTSEAEVATKSGSGQATLVRQALEEVGERYEGQDLAGVILVSDGLATGGFAKGASDGADREFLKSLDTKVHTAWAARPGLKDVAISDVLVDEFAFVRTVARIEVVITSTGFKSRNIPVTLWSEGKALRRKWVDVGGDVEVVNVTFEFSPASVGKFAYRVTTPVHIDEAVESNNQRDLVIRVVRDKFRVLQVAGRPSWDVRAMRGMLKQNPNVDLISFFILRTLDDIPLAPSSELSLIPFPTDELFGKELPSFDLIILQNFDFMPYNLSPYLDSIRQYVEGGGGLVMLGGSLSFSSGGYAGSPIAAALPVELLASRGQGLLNTDEFSPQLTESGKSHPVTALRFSPVDNVAEWKALPALEGINIIGGAKRDATTLAVHPKLRTPGGKPMPVIVVGDYGAGRTLAITTDTLWHWGFAAAEGDGDGRAYDRFWETAMRWLIKDPELELLRISSDKPQYEPSMTANLNVRLVDRDYSPLENGTVQLRLLRGASKDAAQEVAVATVDLDGRGEGRHQFPDLEAGVYRVEGTATVGGRQIVAYDLFLVAMASAELDRSAGDDALLQQIARITGGTYLGPAESLPSALEFAEPRIVRVDRSSDVELWSGAWLLLLAFLFLGLEWGLRQRVGYR